MDENETFEELWDSVQEIMRRQLLETPKQKADRWERIARHLGSSEEEVQSLRAGILNRLN